MHKLNLGIQLKAFGEYCKANKQVKPQHIALYLSLLMNCYTQGKRTAIHIRSSDLMKLSRIGSRRSYFRYMRDLVRLGFISEYSKDAKGANVVVQHLSPATSSGRGRYKAG